MIESTSQSLASGPTTGTIVHTPQTEGDATEALAHLAKMSGTGSAFGGAEYVAISPLAIIALMLGFAGALSIIVSLFLFIPMLGILFGWLAIRQIRNSSGTQGGVGFAFGGIILSLLIGGGVTVNLAVAAARTRAASEQCGEVLSKFGEEIKAQRYDAIYNDMTTEVFRGKVTAKQFRETLAVVRVNPYFGELQYTRWAGNPIDFEPVAGTDAKYAYATLLLKLAKSPDEARETVKLTNRDGGWKFEALPQLFPEPKKSSTGMGR